MPTKAKSAELEVQPGDFLNFVFNGETFRLRKKFKRLRFLRKLGSDPVEALSLAIPSEDLDRIEDMEMEQSDLESLFEAISDSLVGGPKG